MMRHNLVLALGAVALVVILDCGSTLAVRKKTPSYSAEVTQLESPIAAYSPRFRSSLARSINFGNQRVYGAAATGARSLSPRSLMRRSRSKKRSSARSGQQKDKREHTPTLNSYTQDPQANLRLKRDEQVRTEPEHDCPTSQSRKSKEKEREASFSLRNGSHKLGLPGLGSVDLESSPSVQSIINQPADINVGINVGGPSNTAVGQSFSPTLIANSQTNRGVANTVVDGGLLPSVKGSSNLLDIPLGLTGGNNQIGSVSAGSPSFLSSVPLIPPRWPTTGGQLEIQDKPLAIQSKPDLNLSVGGARAGLGSSESKPQSLSLSVGSGGSPAVEPASFSISPISAKPDIQLGFNKGSSLDWPSTGSSPASSSLSNNDYSLSVSPTSGDSEGPVSLTTSVGDDSPIGSAVELLSGGNKAQSSGGESESAAYQNQDTPLEIGYDSSPQSSTGTAKDGVIYAPTASLKLANVVPEKSNSLLSSLSSIAAPIISSGPTYDAAGSTGSIVNPIALVSTSSGNQTPYSQADTSSPASLTIQTGPSTSSEEISVEPAIQAESESPQGTGEYTGSGSSEPTSSNQYNDPPASTSSGDAATYPASEAATSVSAPVELPKLVVKPAAAKTSALKKLKSSIKSPILYESPRIADLPTKCRARLYDMKRALAELVALTENFSQKVLVDRSLSYLTREILSRRLREVRNMAMEARLAGGLGRLFEFKESARDAGLEALRIGNLQSTKKLEPSWTLFAQSLRRLFSVFKKTCKV